MWLGMTADQWVSFAQLIALMSMTLALIAYRRAHPPKENPFYRIEKHTFHDNRIVYYCTRRWPLNQWRVVEVEPGVRGYNTLSEAQQAMTRHFTGMGLELSEAEVVKEYGF